LIEKIILSFIFIFMGLKCMKMDEGDKDEEEIEGRR